MHNNNNKEAGRESEESIYQPIWKFKTVGEAQERYQTDADYYDLKSITKTPPSVKAKAILPTVTDLDVDVDDDDSSLNMPSILISNDVEDHSEWETDDEFMYTTELQHGSRRAADACSLQSGSTVRSSRSNISASGSTVTGFGSSTSTLASALGSSLTHHLFRNIGIFYSLTEPKLRAIIYDYDRIHSSAYFTGRRSSVDLSAAPTSSNTSHSQPSSPPQPQRQVVKAAKCSSNVGAGDDGGCVKVPKERSPMPPPRSTSIAKSSESKVNARSAKLPSSAAAAAAAAAKMQILPDSVQAWKFMLLDVNYIEDEEDMIVSENEIIRAQDIKEDIDSNQTQQLTILQRFKSASFGNLVDIPNEDDKKSIAERVRNKLQRGVLKLNVRSPKSEKKSRGIFRRAEATSLYLEDGMKPKYPIFGAPLDQLELNETSHPNVPRFVVDCVEYIERKDCIQQDGLYRASGNKVTIDELKQKLSESYIYDPKLLVIDDIHTLTSLLKQFFRELGAPLIPQETYERLGRNLADAAGIETMRVAFEDMREPNRSTLKFLIKHLTNVAECSSVNRMPASNLAIVWGPCILSPNQIELVDIGRMNILAKVLIENYEHIFNEKERLVS